MMELNDKERGNFSDTRILNRAFNVRAGHLEPFSHGRIRGDPIIDQDIWSWEQSAGPKLSSASTAY